MNICIPVNADRGLASPVCGHFGSAPLFLVVDTESGTCRAIPNRNLHHAHGMCQPLNSLQGEQLGAIVVGGIGMGALNKLQMAGLQVFQAQHGTVEETLAAFKAGTLPEMTPAFACAHHGHQHQHRHGQSGH
jgi:predicted Fe-Mo cluster-binding NifX family protein